MKNKVTAALQLLPIKEKIDYAIIDKAIELIMQSGLKYKVCPLETVVEGNLSEILKLINQISELSFTEHAESFLLNCKIHAINGKNATIDQKLKKYS